MSGMNVFGTQTTAATDSQKINNSLDLNKINLNIGAAPVFDKVTFDSLLKNLKSDTIVRQHGSKNDYQTEQARNNQEYQDRNKTVDNKSDNRQTEETYRAQEKPDKNIGSVNREQAHNTEEAKQAPEQTDAKTQVQGKENNNDSPAINKDSERAGVSIESKDCEGNAFKVGALLFEMAHAKAGEQTNSGEIQKSGEAVLTDGEQDSGKGLKNGVLLNELLKGKPGETVAMTPSNVKETQGQPGVKAVDLLKDLISAKTAGDVRQQADAAIKVENVESATAEAMKTDSSLKAGEMLKTAAEVKTGEIEKELANAGIKQVGTDSKDTDTEIDELIKKFDKNAPNDKKAEIRQEQIKEHKLQDFIIQKDITDGNNAKAAVTKNMPGMVENLFRESGVKPDVNTAPKTSGEKSDTNNITVLGDVSSKSGGPKINVVSPTGTISKPSGFADVINKIVYFAKGDNKLGVTLEHKELGQLNIKLSLEKGIVNVSINTADKAAREFVESNVQQIVDSLTKSGVSVGGFSVGLKNQQHHEGFGNRNPNKNEKPFSINGIEQQEYSKAAANVYSSNGRVSVFA
jgi:flagellar hook-length control protein FliK